ncbi:lycopene cyclase domain-containing protein [Corynebacterium endometrii]|uniref:Lycopene cyclase domain-containing protein n=1 Tax=Corynebacterium endometrii TaxID=2488819 RepID=A0A4P7QHP9_9CORY|nr:lycopene cyclase domain-containing protein [Corynebacterium endometrii]QCB29242.1 hypothetical protein CENDO_09940 [Corynebacterium endometrii]
MSFFYLGFLAFSLAGMIICDRRWRLAFFHDAKRAWTICIIVVIAFLIWDALGIATGTFFRGGSPYMTGIELAPEMPLEEPIFLFFLTYLTINLTSFFRRMVVRP